MGELAWKPWDDKLPSGGKIFLARKKSGQVLVVSLWLSPKDPTFVLVSSEGNRFNAYGGEFSHYSEILPLDAAPPQGDRVREFIKTMCKAWRPNQSHQTNSEILRSMSAVAKDILAAPPQGDRVREVVDTEWKFDLQQAIESALCICTVTEKCGRCKALKIIEKYIV